MTELDGELPETVLEIIEEFGKAVVYTIAGGASYDPATGQASAPGTLVPGVKVSPPEGYSAFSVSGSGGLIETGDKKVITAALYFSGYADPSAGDTMAFDGTTYTVLRVEPIYSGELVCAYLIQVRG